MKAVTLNATFTNGRPERIRGRRSTQSQWDATLPRDDRRRANRQSRRCARRSLRALSA